MGACSYETTGHGATIGDAYRRACDDARAYNGHQEGYSGDIQTCSGYVEIRLPERVTVAKICGWVQQMDDARWAREEARELREYGGTAAAIRRAEQRAERALKRVPEQHRELAQRVARLAGEKRGRAVAIELTGAPARQYRENAGIKQRVRVWRFFGTGAC